MLKRLGKKCLTFMVILFLIGCATVSRDFERASKIDSIRAYKEFLNKHPSTEFEKVAEARILEIEELAEARILEFQREIDREAKIQREKMEKIVLVAARWKNIHSVDDLIWVIETLLHMAVQFENRKHFSKADILKLIGEPIKKERGKRHAGRFGEKWFYTGKQNGNIGINISPNGIMMGYFHTGIK